METIRQERMGRVKQLMRSRNLDGILICCCVPGNLNTWLLAAEDMPLHLPYNRNNLLLVLPDGTAAQYWGRQPHPTDRGGRFPLFCESELPVFRRLGLVNPAALKCGVREHLQKTSPSVELVDITRDFHLLCAQTTAADVQGVEQATAVMERAFSALPLLLTGQPTEREFAARLRNRVRELGAECEDLGTSAFLELTSAPDGGTSVPEPVLWPGRRLEYGDRVNVLLQGFLPGGFASALGRSCILGEPSEEARTYWDLALQAQQLAAACAVPGATVAQITARVRQEILEPAGLPAYTGCQIHGISADVQTLPRDFDDSRDLPLQENMILVLAIRIAPPGKDPYCCMDPFAVTPQGARRLSTLPQELIVLD